MKILIPVDASQAALAPIDRLAALQRRGARHEALVLNVQPRFHRHVSDLSRRKDRDGLRAERSRDAMAQAIERLSGAAVPFRAVTEVGRPAERIAAVAEREGVDEVMLGVGRHPAWLRWVNPSIAQEVMQLTDIPVTVLARGRAGTFERYALPAGLVGLVALLYAAE
ncbi:MAG TPA: universal stress protein [Burkholderiales bacterium]|nr:universal stress protein [Burkholderiales bacterium]